MHHYCSELSFNIRSVVVITLISTILVRNCMPSVPTKLQRTQHSLYLRVARGAVYIALRHCFANKCPALEPKGKLSNSVWLTIIVPYFRDVHDD